MFYVYFFQISITSSRSCLFSKSSSPPRPIPLTSSLVFDLYLFMRLVKWSRRLRLVTANSSQLLAINGYILPYDSFSLLPHLLSNIPFPTILLIIWMFFSLFHGMIDPRKRGSKRLVCKLLKTWGRKAVNQE